MKSIRTTQRLFGAIRYKTTVAAMPVEGAGMARATAARQAQLKGINVAFQKSKSAYVTFDKWRSKEAVAEEEMLRRAEESARMPNHSI
ncbi:Protein of unknown function [Pyronema omphalodes CBS 100304]|uniref:Uncharacterized protein n=1 Tax=Pyronema omphalodes (strain CBS 100304) TaxID=1076935 RepID=U4L7Y4_PYROM|nr:Protein of unknown function [Pyronema omphalodes CBS 100304]